VARQRIDFTENKDGTGPSRQELLLKQPGREMLTTWARVVTEEAMMRESTWIYNEDGLIGFFFRGTGV
jgi:hypothetical protein